MRRQRRVTMTPNRISSDLFFCPTDPVSQEGRDVVKRTWIFSPTESLRPSSTSFPPMAFQRFSPYSVCMSQRKLRPKHPAQQVIIRTSAPAGTTTTHSNVPDYIWTFNRSCSPPFIPQSPPCSLNWLIASPTVVSHLTFIQQRSPRLQFLPHQYSHSFSDQQVALFTALKK